MKMKMLVKNFGEDVNESGQNDPEGHNTCYTYTPYTLLSKCYSDNTLGSKKMCPSLRDKETAYTTKLIQHMTLTKINMK